MIGISGFAVIARPASAEASVRLGTGAAASAGAGAGAGTRQEHLIHVALQGDDKWSGKLAARNSAGSDGPVRTLSRAQSLAREQIARMANGERFPIRVLIQNGTYFLGAPLLFTVADSGQPASPISYEAVETGKVTLSGGIPLELKAEPRAGAPAVFALPDVARGTARGGGQLFVNEKRATLARQPNAGSFWFVERAISLPDEAKSGPGREAFAPSSDASAWLSRLTQTERALAVVQVLHSWNVSQHRIAAITTAPSMMRLTPPSKWPFLGSGTSQRWFVENIPSALDAAGEWIASDSDVRYLPIVAQMEKPLEAVMPILDNLIQIRGEPIANKWVQNLTFRGLRFAHTRYLTPAEGFVDPQAAIGVGAAVEADMAKNLAIERCEFEHTAAYGVWFRSSVRDSRVIDSRFVDMGGGGVQVGTAARSTAHGGASTENIVIAGNEIGDIGAVHLGAVGIWIGNAFGVTVSRNLIRDTGYSGISVGWTWGFGPSQSGRHSILNNLLVNIGRAHLSDLGAIYTLGSLTGTVIAGNVVREVRAYPGYGPGPGLGAWGIYNDEGTSGVVVENNVVVGTDSGGYHLHFGRQIVVRDNVFAGGRKAEIRLSRSLKNGSQAILENNLIAPEIGGRAFDRSTEASELTLARNQIAEPARGSTDLAACGSGCTQSSATFELGAAPKLIVIKGLDAPTTKRLAGLIAAAGPRNGNAMPGTTRQAVATLASPAPPALAPPLPLTVDLNRLSPGELPDGLSFRPQGDARAVRWISDAAAPSGRCLQFSDGPALTNRFDPHAFARLNHESGTTTSEFSILIDGESQFLHEWRDNSQPYRTGPSLRISAAGFAVSNRIVAAAAVGEWMRVRVTAPLGRVGTPWTLEVQSGGKKAVTVANLPAATRDWQSLNQILYISDAEQTSLACLSAVNVKNTNQ